MASEKNETIVLGLMSGSSLDGVDLALCRFNTGKGSTSYELINAETISYPYYMREKLEDALHLSPNDLHELDQELGRFFANQIKNFIKKTGVSPELIASHGHTVMHQPNKGITLQIGDGDVIAQQTRIMVVSDFRIQDVSKGGQGAPLVPIGDRDLFSEFEFCLNLGGIANISFDNNGKRIAADICPCNMPLNTITSWIDIEFDVDGRMAAKGRVNKDLLDRMNALEYYKMPLPKSLGKEWFLWAFLPEIRKTRISIEDALCTVNEHIAIQLADFINQYASKSSTILLTGGGAYNKFLIELLRKKCVSEIYIPETELVDFKEAIVFAYLGMLRIQGKVNVLSSVTGSKSDTCAGVINNPNE